MRLLFFIALLFALTPAAHAAPDGIVLTFVGDCTLGSDINFGYEGTLPAVIDAHHGDLSYVFRNVAAIFAADDLTVVNLEGTLTDRGTRQTKEFAFRGPPSYARMLALGGVEAASLANNHTYDYGDEGYSDTINALNRNGIAWFDEGRVLRTAAGGIPVGIVGYAGFYATDGLKEQLAAAIASLKAEGRFVAVCFHWGIEGSYLPDGDQVELAHHAIDRGADLVVGHHPHVLQGIEFYKHRPIAYSLGNFVFGGNMNPNDKRTMLLQIRLRQGAVAVRVIPACISSVDHINDYQPRLLAGDEKTRFFRWYNTISAVQFQGDDWVSVTAD